MHLDPCVQLSYFCLIWFSLSSVWRNWSLSRCCCSSSQSEYTLLSRESFLQHLCFHRFQVKSTVDEEFNLYRFCFVGLNFFHGSQCCRSYLLCRQCRWQTDFSMLVVFICPFSVCNKQILHSGMWTNWLCQLTKTNARHSANKGVLAGLTRILLENWVRNSLSCAKVPVLFNLLKWYVYKLLQNLKIPIIRLCFTNGVADDYFL